MKASTRTTSALSLVLVLLLATAPLALADEAGPEDQAVDGGPLQALAGILVAVVLVVGLGCLFGVLRVVFPGAARGADEALDRFGTGAGAWRLLLMGILPLVGAALLGAAADATRVQALQVVWGIVVGLPVTILIVVGAMAGVPRLGAGLLRRGEERSLLARCITGALVLGLALGALVWAVKPVASVLALVVAGWFFGAGLGTVFRPRAASGAPGENGSAGD